MTRPVTAGLSMSLSEECLELLACPRCDAALLAQPDGLDCKACQVRFPVLDGLPWLFAEPAYALGEWRARLHLELQSLTQRAARLERELADPALLPDTRDRLRWLHDACRDQRGRLESLLAPLLDGRDAAARETYLALRTRLPSDQGLNTYAANLHRDWAWGLTENRQSCEIVASQLPADAKRLLVLGAGAGRLACDLHRAQGAELTVALDFNPLLASVGQRLSRGGNLELWEFPLAPRGPRDVAVLNRLQGLDAGPGLQFLLGDVLRAPLAAGRFDAVITPWLIDILDVELRELAPRVNRLLRAGGAWVNFGSLAFAHAQEAMNYSLPECAELIATSGFGDWQAREDRIAYLHSPASRHARDELTVCWRASKTAEAPALPRHSALPEWLVTGREPVPLKQDFALQAANTRIRAYVLGLIDGRRSIRDMAKLLERERLMRADEAAAVIRRFLIQMLDDSRRRDLP